MTTTMDRSVSVSANQTLEAQPYEVFPLLCPVREYDWIDDWDCSMISSRTGIAELNCVFSTKRDYGHSKPVEEVWVITRYEPSRAIEFVKFCGGLYVIKYDIWLTSLPNDQTQAIWTQTHIPLSARGETALESVTQGDFQNMIKGLEDKLNRFLGSGRTMSGAKT